MKKLSLFLLSCIFVCGACTKTGTDDVAEPKTLGDAVWLSAEAGSTESYTYDISESWEISNTSSWLTVSPESGLAGENVLTFTADTENTELGENVGYVDLAIGSETQRIYVFQRGVRGLEVDVTNFTILKAATELQFTVLANEEFSVETAENWVTISVPDEGEVTLLDDGVSESELKSYTVTLSVAEYDGDAEREADISVSSENATASVKLTQYVTLDNVEPDFNSTFYRHSLAMRFTATWCGYCPIMAESFNQAIAELPERIIPFTIHASNSNLYSDYASSLAAQYGISGYPMGYVNGYALVQNYAASVGSSLIVNLANEATTNLPSKTAIMGEASYNNGIVDVDIYVAAKEAGNYILYVYLMESGIVAYQNSSESAYPGGNNYVHNYVERSCLTSSYRGAPFTTSSANTVNKFEYSYTVPSGRVVNIDNTYIVAYISYPGTYTGSVNNAIYNSTNYVIDNAITISYDEPTLYTYED